jgi:multiple sugar transport system substrate-binding protein
MDVTLRGMTWSHPRGIDPLVACSAQWRQQTGVAIEWDARSLQDFESFSVRDLAARYDLLVIDHPHVGQVTAEGCLLPLDTPGRDAALAEILAGSVGRSAESYRWTGRLWALPIDAAAQVQAWRSDLLQAPLTRWAEVLTLAAERRVMCPLRSPHALMALYTLAANLGTPCQTEGLQLIDPVAGRRAYGLLLSLAELLDPACLSLDPIEVLEAMSTTASRVCCAPLIYGYARAGFRTSRLSFTNIPSAERFGPVGSALGGTGLAVSARSAHPDQAADFAYWVAGGSVQAGVYAENGGQPAHLDAWLSTAVNEQAGGFYQDTLTTLQQSWLRPRFDGYMGFQSAASDRLVHALRTHEDGIAVIDDLNGMFAAARRGAG